MSPYSPTLEQRKSAAFYARPPLFGVPASTYKERGGSDGSGGTHGNSTRYSAGSQY